MITILTLIIGHDFRKALKVCSDSKRDYAERHGYKYSEGGEEYWDRSRPIPWSKVPFVLAELSKLPDGTILWLSDADVLITNPALRLEDHILPHFPAEKDMFMTIDSCGHLNSGNMFLRNSPWLRDFWKRVGEQTDLTYHIWWENAAMIALYESVPTDAAMIEITREHKRFNAYLRGLEGEPLWTPGDFLVHFAGVYNPKDIQDLTSRILAGETPRIPM
jgi:hypothetical protein